MINYKSIGAIIGKNMLHNCVQFILLDFLLGDFTNFIQTPPFV